MGESSAAERRRGGCMVPLLWIVTLLVVIALFAICVVLVFTTHLVIKPIIPTP